MIPNFGPMEIGIVLLLALVVFGPKRLPELGSSLGKGIREFGKGIKAGDEEKGEALEAPGDSSRDSRSVSAAPGGVD